MKKTTFLLSICLLATMLVTLAVPAFAADKDIKTDYFPSGKLQTPEAPYIVETQFEGQSTQLKLYYYITADLQKLALDKQNQNDFDERYGIADIVTFIQIDVKFNDGAWLSESGQWGKLNEFNEIDYGENIDANNLAFLNIGLKNTDDADKLQSFTQSWLTYFDVDESNNAYFKPYVKAVDNDGTTEYVFDFANNKITYRIRSCVKCLIDAYTENEKCLLLTSDWSPETSYGKNGTQQELIMPEIVDAPMLSEFSLSANTDGSGEIRYFATLPDSIYDAERYQLIVKEGFQPYYIDAEVKINDGEWFSVYVANSVWLQNGSRASTVTSEHQLKTTDDAWIRARVCKTEDDTPLTEWSNIIGTKTYEGASDSTPPEGNPTGEPTDPGTTEKTKCKVCGICPFQPLDICLFIWLIIILVVILIIVIAVVVANKKKKKKTE